MRIRNRSRHSGIDTDGKIRHLGDLDSTGVPIGWIDEDGCCWESLRERDVSVAAGRWIDADREWKLGKRTRRPNKVLFALREVRGIRNAYAALKNIKIEERLWAKLAIQMARSKAKEAQNDSVTPKFLIIDQSSQTKLL